MTDDKTGSDDTAGSEDRAGSEDGGTSGGRAAKLAVYDLDLTGARWQCAPGDAQGSQVEIAFLAGGAVAMRNAADPSGRVLRYTAEEWDAFVKGAKAGEFDPET